ncbi:MAG TPA: translation initiation factor [Chitinophagaceae bacterium]|nr:translation initiation factor [Chitinophagaceae bacterium]
MSKKNKPDKQGFVYSTDPSFRFEEEQEATQETLAPEKQKLRINYETKHRGGKAVTLVTGFKGTMEDMEELGKKIKQYCGTGGSVKDGEIIIQGDQRAKVRDYLTKNKYRVS